jgi:hypothetical protein
MGGLGAAIGIGGHLLGDKGAGAAKQAGQQQRAWQQKGLDYLLEADVLPQEIRKGSLGQLGALFGVTGDAQAQAGAIEALRGTPIYQAIMGGKEGGEEAILRQASATGGLRSGNVQESLYDYNVQLENQALMQGLQGLTGLSGVRTGEAGIAGQYNLMGGTAAQQTIGEAQSKMAGYQMAADTAMGLGQMGLGAASVFSDRRLKDHVVHIGKMGRFNLYSWVWNAVAKELGLTGPGVGVMVDEVEKVVPEAIGEQMGFKTVNYAMIGV